MAINYNQLFTLGTPTQTAYQSAQLNPQMYQGVQGATSTATTNIPAAKPTTTTTRNTGGGGGYSAPVNNPQPQQPQQPAYDPYAAVRNDISNAWDSYLNSLGSTSGYLNDQNTAQQQIANSQYDQGANTIQTQKASSLKDIASTTRNAFQAGNNYLGQLGAGDSSAANQYTFAINQQANKQTGDLNNYVNTQLQNLGYTRDQQLSQIAQWFSSAQQQLKQQIAQGQLSKGQDLANLSKGILDQAIAATNQVKTTAQNQYNSLLTWAANNSTNISQLQSNIAQIPQAMGQIQTYGGQSSTPVYGGSGANQRTDIFGNPIRA